MALPLQHLNQILTELSLDRLLNQQDLLRRLLQKTVFIRHKLMQPPVLLLFLLLPLQNQPHPLLLLPP